MGTRVRRRVPKKRCQPLPQGGAGYLLDVPLSDPELWELYATAMGQPVGTLPSQLGAGLFSFVLRPLARLFGKKAAAKRLAQKVTNKAVKRVAKKVGKKAALGAATAAGSWATQKALDSL